MFLIQHKYTRTHKPVIPILTQQFWKQIFMRKFLYNITIYFVKIQIEKKMCFVILPSHSCFLNSIEYILSLYLYELMILALRIQKHTEPWWYWCDNVAYWRGYVYTARIFVWLALGLVLVLFAFKTNEYMNENRLIRICIIAEDVTRARVKVSHIRTLCIK